MASSTMSSYLHNKLLSQILQKKDPQLSFDKIYIALMNQRPNANGSGGREVSTSGTGYARQAIDRAEGSFVQGGTENNPTFTNASEVAFPKPTANWGSIVCLALYDAPTAGNLLWVGNGTAREVTANDAGPIVNIGDMSFVVANC